MGIIMYSTILAGAPISFGPTSFEQYLVIGGSSVVLMMLMQYLAGWRLSRRDYMRALQDNFTVFMTLIRAILIGFLGFEMGFAVTNKVCTVLLLLLLLLLSLVALLLKRRLLLHACNHKRAVAYCCCC
jgi:hypothetical protein